MNKLILLTILLILLTSCANIQTRSEPPNPYYNYWEGAWFRHKMLR